MVVIDELQPLPPGVRFLGGGLAGVTWRPAPAGQGTADTISSRPW
jgi:hypothetical protein